MSFDLTIVIPTYNERENIPVMVERLTAVLRNINWEVIFVDDDSPDGTADVVRAIAARNPKVRCIQRIRRRGLASACIEGILASSAPVVAIMDADMQHDETILPAMLQMIHSGADLVIGSRYAQGGSTGELSSMRVRISQAATKFSRIVMKHAVSDPMSGFFMMKRPFFEQVVRNLSGKGFKILLDILVSAKSDAVIMEKPYTMRKRSFGESKLDASVIWEFITLVIFKFSGRIIPYRFLSFAAVGFTGIFVQLFALWLCFRILNLEFIISQILATLVAMTSNFILNNQFTFNEQKLKGKGLLSGLLTFYIACSLGAVINVAVADLLFNRSFPWWLAGTLGAVAGAVWNYATTATFTWRTSVGKSAR
ncbi:MAG TPA: glycosyltransferase family 2 protein [Gammaproteobacteria bacterium]|nr:glycosyltransferase family 2 protein [Gammaproteobacteria bacterium]